MNSNYNDEIVAKILILGDSKVGKSSILTRFAEGYWSPNTVATLGKTFYGIMLRIHRD